MRRTSLLLLTPVGSRCAWTLDLAYLVGLAGLKDVTGHLGLRVVGLAPQEIGKIGEVIAVVDEARDELCFVLEYKDWGVGAAGGDASDEGGVEDQLNFSRLHHGAAVAPLTTPADLRHQPRQHGQGGPPVQRGPADVSQGEPSVWLRRTVLPLIPTLHVDPADSGPKLVDSDVGLKITFENDAVAAFPATKAGRSWAQFETVSMSTSIVKVHPTQLHAQHVLALSINCSAPC